MLKKPAENTVYYTPYTYYIACSLLSFANNNICLYLSDPKHRAWGGKSTSKQKTTQSDLGAPAKRYPPNKDTIVAETVQTLVTEGAGKYTEEGLVAATTEVSETEVTRGLETTLQRLMANVAKKRATAGRPDDLEVSLGCIISTCLMLCVSICILVAN